MIVAVRLQAELAVSTRVIFAAENLRSAASQLRLQSVQAKISLAFTFCRIAETEMLAGNLACAQQLIKAVRQKAEFLRHHIKLPNHVPPEVVEHLQDEVMRLEEYILRIEAQYPAQHQAQPTAERIE